MSGSATSRLGPARTAEASTAAASAERQNMVEIGRLGYTTSRQETRSPCWFPKKNENLQISVRCMEGRKDDRPTDRERSVVRPKWLGESCLVTFQEYYHVRYDVESSEDEIERWWINRSVPRQQEQDND